MRCLVRIVLARPLVQVWCPHVHVLLLQRAGSTATNIPCFTSIREPVERLVSLYYYVMDKWRIPVTKLLQDMTAAEAVEALQGLWPLMRQTPLLSHFGT